MTHYYCREGALMSQSHVVDWLAHCSHLLLGHARWARFHHAPTGTNAQHAVLQPAQLFSKIRLSSRHYCSY